MKFFWLVVFLIFSVFVFGDQCHFDPVPIPEPSEAATRFYHSGNIVWVIQQGIQILLPALILFTGLSSKMSRFSHFLGKNVFFTFVIFVLLYMLLVSLLCFPFEYYSTFVRPHTYSLSTQAFPRWFKHHLMNTGLSIGTSLIVLGILYLFIRKSPKRWWLYMGLMSLPLLFFFQIVQPLWIAPLFNDFGPMKNKHLEIQVANLAKKAGIENSRIYEVNKSADTSRMNAYVIGLGKTKRIVFWDTIVTGLSEKELLFVAGHEMGHYVLSHIWWGVFFFSGITLLILWLIHLSAKFFLHVCPIMGFKTLRNVASLPLILMLYSFFSFVFLPIENLFGQKLEHDADRFGLELTHLNHAAGTSFLKLMGTNLGYPWPGKFYMLFRSSHPSIGSRMEFFNTYHPWCDENGQKYFNSDEQTSPHDRLE